MHPERQTFSFGRGIKKDAVGEMTQVGALHFFLAFASGELQLKQTLDVFLDQLNDGL